MMALVPQHLSVPHSGLLFTLNRICDNKVPQLYNTMATSCYQKCQGSDNILKVLCHTAFGGKKVFFPLKMLSTTGLSTMVDATALVAFSR